MNHLHALRVFTRCASFRMTLRTFAPYLHASRALLCILQALFSHLHIFLGWIYSPLKCFKFRRTIKSTINRASFMWVERHS